MLLCTLCCICLHIKILYTKILQIISGGTAHCCFFLFNGLVFIIIKVLFVGHVFQSRIFVYFKFIEYPYILFLWFLVWVTFFTIYHVDVIISKGYPGGCFFRHVGHPQGVLLLSGRIPQISIRWGFAGTAITFMTM